MAHRQLVGEHDAIQQPKKPLAALRLVGELEDVHDAHDGEAGELLEDDERGRRAAGAQPVVRRAVHLLVGVLRIVARTGYLSNGFSKEQMLGV